LKQGWTKDKIGDKDTGLGKKQEARRTRKSKSGIPKGKKFQGLQAGDAQYIEEFQYPAG